MCDGGGGDGAGDVGGYADVAGLAAAEAAANVAGPDVAGAPTVGNTAAISRGGHVGPDPSSSIGFQGNIGAFGSPQGPEGPTFSQSLSKYILESVLPFPANFIGGYLAGHMDPTAVIPAGFQGGVDPGQGGGPDDPGDDPFYGYVPDYEAVSTLLSGGGSSSFPEGKEEDKETGESLAFTGDFSIPEYKKRRFFQMLEESSEDERERLYDDEFNEFTRSLF